MHRISLHIRRNTNKHTETRTQTSAQTGHKHRTDMLTITYTHRPRSKRTHTMARAIHCTKACTNTCTTTGHAHTSVSSLAHLGPSIKLQHTIVHTLDKTLQYSRSVAKTMCCSSLHQGLRCIIEGHFAVNRECDGRGLDLGQTAPGCRNRCVEGGPGPPTQPSKYTNAPTNAVSSCNPLPVIYTSTIR